MFCLGVLDVPFWPSVWMIWNCLCWPAGSETVRLKLAGGVFKCDGLNRIQLRFDDAEILTEDSEGCTARTLWGD
jgi:hypothetical protein